MLSYAKLCIFWTVRYLMVHLVLLESSLPKRVRKFCFMAFRPIVQKLWIFDPYLHLGCLFVYYVLFVLYVTLRSPKPCVSQSHCCYCQKALGKERCMGFVSWCLDSWCESYWIFKVIMNKKIRKLLLFLFGLWKLHKVY